MGATIMGYTMNVRPKGCDFQRCDVAMDMTSKCDYWGATSMGAAIPRSS